MKIALIAMNGLLVRDPGLIDWGLTLPGILDRGKALASIPSLALLTLAGMTDPRHSLTYIEIPNLAEATPLNFDFDMVAISSYSAQIFEAYEVADRYRAAGIPVVMGGPHVTYMPQEAAQHCDAVSIGEGEATWRQIVADCEKGELKPLYGAIFSEFDMKDAPTPAFEILNPSLYNRLIVQTSRGCPHLCEFCASSILISRRYKQKSQEKVLREIDIIREIWRHPFIEFADDNSFINKAYWHQLLPELAKRRVRWFAETDISIASDDALLGRMHDAGCAEVLIGLESPNLATMNKIELRSNWKSKRWSDYKNSVRRIQSKGIRVIGCFVLGLDGQDESVFDDLYNFASELDLFDVQVTVQTAFPGTPLYARLKNEGRLIDETDWSKCTLFDVNFHPSGMTADQLRESFLVLMQRLYTKELAESRRNSFSKNLRSLRRAS